MVTNVHAIFKTSRHDGRKFDFGRLIDASSSDGTRFNFAREKNQF